MVPMIHLRLHNPQGRLEGNLQVTEARNRIRQKKMINKNSAQKFFRAKMKIVDPFEWKNGSAARHTLFASKVGGVVTRFEVTVVISVVSPVTYVFVLLWLDYL